MEKSDIKLYCFYVFQIPLAFLMSYVHDCIIKLPYLPNPQTLSGVFLVFLVISTVIVIPFIILMRKNQYLKENHLGFAVMFFCMAFILNYYGKMEYDKDPRSFNFVQVLYFIISTSNIIVYFLVDGILKQVEKQKSRQQNMDHIKNQDDKDSKIIEANQAEVKTDTENVQNEVEMVQNHQETISNEQKNKEGLFYLGAIALFSAIWIVVFPYTFMGNGDSDLFLFFINSVLTPVFITWGYHQNKILCKRNFSEFLYIVNLLFFTGTSIINTAYLIFSLPACVICIAVGFKVHDMFINDDKGAD